MESLLEVGQIVNTYGIKGYVKVAPWVDSVKQFQEFNNVYIEEKKEIKELYIEEVKFSKNLVLLKFKDIEIIEQAEMLRNCILKVKRSDIKLEDGAHFIVDLIGLEVYTVDGKLLGKLKEVLQPGANDVYIIEDDQKNQILLPAIPDVIKNIDIDNKKMVVELLKGLI